MRVFVLGTGRCGTFSFVHACQHITNYTCGHETRSCRLGDDRFAYPDNHIEADNRLSWFLGTLDRRFGKEPLYIHLLRNPEEVARSYNRRWQKRVHIIPAFAYGVMHRVRDWQEKDRIDVCRLYVQSVNDNITMFLRDKPKTIVINLENIQEGFREFWHMSGATGDLEDAIKEWKKPQNVSAKDQSGAWLRKLFASTR